MHIGVAMSQMNVSLLDIVISLSDVMDLIDPSLSKHHKRVACIALAIGREIQLPHERLRQLFIAALLHDCGALSTQERLSALTFDMLDAHQHAETGYKLLDEIHYFKDISEIVKYHHTTYLETVKYNKVQVPVESQILHIADRIDVLINKEKDVLNQVNTICSAILSESGGMFTPALVESVLRLSSKVSFWLDIVYLPYFESEYKEFDTVYLNLENVENVTRLFERIIDFRSRFTATHSSGVAAVAEAIGRCIGLVEEECKVIRIAGFFHDLGKLAIPVTILEKKEKLSIEEFNIIRKHTYHSYHILERIDGFKLINQYASLHHERLNGKGYPFRLQGEEISLGARIMGVADVFTAITEDRPYRKGLKGNEALSVLENMAHHQELDARVVEHLKRNYDKINYIRMQAQKQAEHEYEQFIKSML